MKNRFSILLSLGTTSFVILIFALFSWLSQQYIYQALIEQAVKDNKVIGESILSLLQRVHGKNFSNNLDDVIDSFQNTCDLLKLPNQGFVCAVKDDGALVAFPNLSKSDRGKKNFNNFRFADVEDKQNIDFKNIKKQEEFAGTFQDPDLKTSDIIVKIRHASGLHILVHQNKNSIGEYAAMHSKNLFYFGLLSSFLIGIIVYVFVNREVNIYQTTINRQQEVIIQANQEIRKQHEDIVASINYAKRIQTALLPHEEAIKYFFPETLILYLPKDIVSGDFYWVTQTTDYYFLAVADCTGHGVSGAFMTIIGEALLDQIINIDKFDSPAQILTELDIRLLKALHQKDEQTEKINDGMDIVLLRTDKKRQGLTWASAKRPLWVFEMPKGELTEYKGDKFPIGSSQFKQKVFTERTLDSLHNAIIYAFTDGYADQFGKEGKLTIKRFRELLKEIYQQPFPSQETILKERLSSWQKEEKQTDDILILGIKI